MTQTILYLSGCTGFLMAWAIGAQDVSNALGTCVGSKAITITQAIIIGGVFEFLGSLMGGDVAHTISKGLVRTSAIQSNVELYVMLMFCTLTGTFCWLAFATYFSLPVSTTHSLVGSILGLGLVVYPSGDLNTTTLGTIMASWISSPLMGFTISYSIFYVIYHKVLTRPQPAKQALRILPYMYAFTLGILTLFLCLAGPRSLRTSLQKGIAICLIVCVIVTISTHLRLTRRMGERGSSSISSSCCIINPLPPSSSSSSSSSLIALMSKASSSFSQVALGILFQCQNVVHTITFLVSSFFNGPHATAHPSSSSSSSSSSTMISRHNTKNYHGGNDDEKHHHPPSQSLSPSRLSGLAAVSSSPSLVAASNTKTRIINASSAISSHSRQGSSTLSLLPPPLLPSSSSSPPPPSVPPPQSSSSSSSSSLSTKLVRMVSSMWSFFPYKGRAAEVATATRVTPTRRMRRRQFQSSDSTATTAQQHHYHHHHPHHHHCDEELDQEGGQQQQQQQQQKKKKNLSSSSSGNAATSNNSSTYCQETAADAAVGGSTGKEVVVVVPAVQSLLPVVATSSSKERDVRLQEAESHFTELMVITACVVAFAHGSNDISNAIGPFSVIMEASIHGDISHNEPIPKWVLVAGGVGIVVGLATYGHRVMATVGEKITKLTFTRGFSAQIGTALTVLSATIMGISVSTTHCLIGAIAGVAMVESASKINVQTLKKIALSWVVTMPASALCSLAALWITYLVMDPEIRPH